MIEVGSSTVLPGLIGTHTHLFLQGENPAAGGYDVQLLKFAAAYRAARAVVAARRALEADWIKVYVTHRSWLDATDATQSNTDWGPADTDGGRRDRKRAQLHEVSFRKALRAGVMIAFGTDVGGFSWSLPIAAEFAREVDSGMTPMQAIQSATSRAAELLGQQGEVGVIAPGAYADLIAVSGDPLIRRP